MSIFTPRTWSWINVACLKWATFAIGLIIGAYYPEAIMKIRWPLTIIFAVCTIKVAYFFYFKKPS